MRTLKLLIASYFSMRLMNYQEKNIGLRWTFECQCAMPIFHLNNHLWETLCSTWTCFEVFKDSACCIEVSGCMNRKELAQLLCAKFDFKSLLPLKIVIYLQVFYKHVYLIRVLESWCNWIEGLEGM